jgi:serine/threonine-protein kinase
MTTVVRTVGDATANGAVEAPDVLPPGSMAGPWRVERELGRGGMGAVYAVVHESIGKRAALKIVHRSVLSPTFNVERVLQEAKVVNCVDHPNIVDIFETGQLDDGRPYIVMERLEGQTLAARADKGRVRPDLAIAILLQVGDALIAAHAAHVVHRDLKLDNVFLVDNPHDPEKPSVKLLDWGIAKLIDRDVRYTIEGQLVGTPQYLAPEQARGAQVTPQTDVYSLGVMAFELFMEQLPFEAETAAEVMTMHLRVPPPKPSGLWPEIPPALEHLILGMLAKQPERRPTMLEVVGRLAAIGEELQRKRAAEIAAMTPPVGPAGFATGSCPPRIMTVGVPEPAKASDPLGWRYQPSKRWQFLLGAAALIGSTLLFAASRSDPPAAMANTPARAAVVKAAPSPPAREPAPVMPAEYEATTEHDSTSRAPTRPRPKAAPRASPRKASATPRRPSGKLDPDGTIDPYP